MTNIIPLAQAQGDLVAERWAVYLSAKDRADASRRLEDGIAAGRAWREFLNAFTPAETRDAFRRFDDHMARGR
jgi:hypothetical protein